MMLLIPVWMNKFMNFSMPNFLIMMDNNGSYTLKLVIRSISLYMLHISGWYILDMFWAQGLKFRRKILSLSSWNKQKFTMVNNQTDVQETEDRGSRRVCK